MTLDSLALVTYPVLLVIAGFLIKNWIKDFKESVKTFQVTMVDTVKELKNLIEKYSDNQRICQLSLATTYRTKAEAEKDWRDFKLEADKDWRDMRTEQSDHYKDIYARIEELNTRLTKTETRRYER